MMWYGMVWYGMVWYGMVWYGRSYGQHLGDEAVQVAQRLGHARSLAVAGGQLRDGLACMSRCTSGCSVNSVGEKTCSVALAGRSHWHTFSPTHGVLSPACSINKETERIRMCVCVCVCADLNFEYVCAVC